MTSSSPSPGRPRHSGAQAALETLGGRLRDLRLEAGLTGRQLALACGWHSSKVSRIEHGQRPPTIPDVRLWCEACDAAEREADLVATLQAMESMWTEWRRMERAGFRGARQSVTPLFDEAREYHAYSSCLLPAVVQTPEYIRAVLRAVAARRELPEDPDDIQASVDGQVARQAALRDPRRRFSLLIEESLLRSGVADVETLSAQLGHLLVCAAMPTVHLGIVPMRPGRHAAWPVESFWIFDNRLVAVELVSGFLQATQPYDIAQYARAFAELSRAAVFGSEARALIARAVAELGDLASAATRRSPAPESVTGTPLPR